MDLILWRHAEALELREGADDPALDLERPLTPKGERQAQRMAAWLNQRLTDRTRILCSPALRTQQTAKALERKFRITDAVNPQAGPDALLAACRWPDAGEPVLIVGHQPALGQVAARLMGGDPLAGWSIKKGGVWWLRRRERGGEFQVVLQAVQNVECL